jgi:AraC-like DNA-binding protein
MNFRYHFSLLLLVCFLGNLCAQEKDSLRSLTYDELKKSFFSSKKTDIEIAKKYATLSLQKAIAEQNADEESIAHLLVADIENELTNYVIALQEADKTIAHSKKVKNKAILKLAYKVKGSVYRNLGQYENAILYYLKVDSIAQVDQDVIQQVKSNHDIGLIKHDIGQHQDAADIFLENLEKIKPVTDKKVTFLNTYIALTASYIYIDTKKAAEYNKEIKKLVESDANDGKLFYYYLFEGKIHVFEKKYEEAQPFLAKAAQLAIDLQDERNLFAVYRLQGKCYLELQQFEKAIEVLEKAKAIKVKQQFLLIERYEVLSLLASSYERNGQRKEALLNYEEALAVMEQNKEVKNTASKLIEVGFDITYFKNKIKELTEILSKEQQSNQLLRYVGLALLTILLFVSYRFQTQKRKNKVKFKDLLAHIESLEKNQSQKPVKSNQKTKKISDEQAESILAALEKFEQNHGFLNSKTSLTSLAKKANTNTSYLSKMINTHKGQTFKNYITTLRINYALQRLKNDKQFRSYSIKGISEELGFKSEGSFSRAFKAQTGIYPSYFIKNITAGL